MAFFEDLGKKISQTSQGVVQKTKDTAEVIKLNGMITEEEKHIENVYNQIGKKYFEIYAESCDSVFAEFVAEIKTAKSKIEEYSEQVKKLKGIVRCPHCGSDVQYGSAFCNICGNKMDVANTAQGNDSNVLRCVKCGSAISEGSAFCTSCGTKVEKADDTVLVNNVLDNTVVTEKKCPNCNSIVGDNAFCINCGTNLGQAVAEVAEPVAQVAENKCPNCGSPVGNNAFCTNCGANIATGYEDVVIEENVTLPNVKVCPVCNNQVNQNAVFCINCGNKLD